MKFKFVKSLWAGEKKEDVNVSRIETKRCSKCGCDEFELEKNDGIYEWWRCKKCGKLTGISLYAKQTYCLDSLEKAEKVC